MSRLRIPGIDHGTSNSAIAVMEGDGPRVLKPNGVDEIMPYAVHMDRTGRTLVGQLAYKAMMTADPKEGNGHTGYKTRLGQDDRYEFAAAKKVMTGPELGALVIGELLKAYQHEFKEAPRACVITVPAIFDQAAFEATREIGRLAGLEYCEFVQEPIAAALAYAFSGQDERAKWLIFDLGARTLDISLVQVRQGEPDVPKGGNIGDNLLGGRKFDRELMAYVLGPQSSDTARWERYRKLSGDYNPLRKQYALENFSETTNRGAWGKLMLAVERAKIELSRRKEADVQVDGVLCTDERGRPVRVEMMISRGVYEQLIAPDAERAVHLCQTLLARNRLTPKDVQRLVLIGGPTKTPYIRDVLEKRLGIPLEDSIDPMTAVAIGAGIHAAHIELPADIKEKLKSSAETVPSRHKIALEYERSSKQPTHFVAGKIEAAQGQAGPLSVEIRRSDGQWSSGRLPVNAGGVFTASVSLINRGKASLSQFTTTLLDNTGRVLASVNEPEVWFQLPGGDVKPHLTNSLRVGIESNETHTLIAGNVELPNKGKATLKTSALLRSGSTDVLEIPILQAVSSCFGTEDEHADCGVRVGVLKIHGTDIKRDLPEGSPVEVRLECNESQLVRLEAYIPALGEHFECEFEGAGYNVTPKDVAQRFDQAERALRTIENLQQEHPLPEVANGLETIRKSNVLSGLAEEIGRATAGEATSLSRSYRRTLELAGSLNHLMELQRPARIRRHIGTIGRKLTGKDVDDLRNTEADFERAVAGSDGVGLKRIEQTLDDLEWRIRRRPVVLLFQCYRAFPERFKGTQQQLDAFRAMEQVLVDVGDADKAGKPLSDDLLRRVEEVRQRVVSLWDKELQGWMKDLPPITAGDEGRVVLRK